MAGISFLDRDKKMVRFGLWYIRKEIKKNRENIHEDLINCGNPVIRKIYNKIKTGLDEIEEKHQREASLEMVEFFLWILYKDTAYRQPAFYLLKEILDMKNEIYKDTINYSADPKDWYVNQWHKSKEITKKKQEEGSLAEGKLSYPELIYVPKRQSAKFKKINEDMEKKRRKWW